MRLLTTKRGRKVKLLTPPEWYGCMYGEHGRSDGLAAYEQMCFQSRDYKVCIECLSPYNLVEQENHLLPTDGFHSKDYFMCQSCLDYYNNKG